MRLLDRTALPALASTLLAGLLLAVPAVAHAQAEEDPEAVDAEDAPDADPDADPEMDPDAEPGDLEGDDDDDDDAALPKPDPNSELSTWGVGGKEPDGRFRPRGKTGKLAELEGEEDDAREEELEGPAELPPPGYAYLDTVIGFGRLGIVGNTEQQQGATDITPTASFLINFGYRIGDTWGVYARFPISTGANNGPEEPFTDGAEDPDEFKQISTGALEIGTAPIFTLTKKLWLPVGLGLTLPTGQGDMFPDPDNRGKLGQAVVNHAAAASRGWEDRALFAYQRVGIIPKVGVVYQIPDLGPGKLWLRADTKFEIMIKTGGTEPVPRADNTIGKVNNVAFNWVLAPDVSYEAFDGLLRGGLKFWVAVGTPLEELVLVADESSVVSPGGAALTFEPYVATHYSFVDDGSFGLDAKLSLVGNAAGEPASGEDGAGTLGLRMGAGVFF